MAKPEKSDAVKAERARLAAEQYATASPSTVAPPAEPGSDGRTRFSRVTGQPLQPVTEAQVRPTWDDINHQVNSGNQLAEIVNPDGSTTYVTQMITPDLFKKFGSPSDPKGGATWGTIPIPTVPLPSEEEAKQMAYELGDMFVALYEDAPETAHWLMNNPRMMFAIPEVAAVINDFYGDYGATEAVLDYLVADIDVVDYGHWSLAQEKNPATAQFFQDYARFFSHQELDVMATVWSGLSAEGQDNLAALSWRWLNRGDGEGEGAPDLTQDTVKAEFLQFMYEQGAQTQEWELGEKTGLGRVGAWVDAPRRAVYGAASDAWAWATTIGNPQEQIYREALTLGQNIAITQGIDPSETAWKNWSGFYDGLSATVGDPLNLLLGLGIASKMSKTVAVSAPAASRAGRLATAAKAAIPIVGRKASNLPKFSRAPSVRFFHQILGKTTDELIELAAKNGVFSDMHTLMQAKGVAGLIERYPEMENLVDGAADILRRAKSPEHFQDIITELRHGDWLGEDSAGYLRLTNDLAEAEKARFNEFRKAALSGDISIQGMMSGLDKVNTAKTGIWVGGTKSGSILEKADLAGDGTRKIVFAGPVKVQKVNETFLKQAIKWANQLRKDAFGAGTSLSKSQEVGLTSLASTKATDAVNPYLKHRLPLKQNAFDLGEYTADLGEYTAKNGEVVQYFSKPGKNADYVVVKDGKVIGFVENFDEVAAFTDEAWRGQGLVTGFMSKVPDGGESLVKGMLAGSGSISIEGAETAKALAAKKLAEARNTSVVDGMIVKVIEGRIQDLSPDELALFMKFANQKNADLIDFGLQGSILTKNGEGKAILALDSADVAADAARMADFDTEIMQIKTLQQKMKAGSRTSWIIADLPTKIVPEWKLSLKPWRKFATNDAAGWWGRFRRTQAARLMGQAAGKSVDLKDTVTGGRDLRNVLRQLGATREFINDTLNKFYVTPRAERYEFLAETMIRAGEHIDHPLLQYGLEQITRKSGVFSFGIGPDGAELAVGASRSREGAKSALPYMPSQLTDSFELPGPDFFRSLTRYRQAGTFRALGLSGKNRGGLVRGLTKSTGQAREELAKSYGAKLKARGVDISMFDNEDLMAMAYAKVTGDVNGIGKLQWAMNGLSWPFKRVHNFFTRIQLAGRPITWMLRVAALEEGIRAQFFDLPSFYRNPIRWMGGFHDAMLTTKLSAHRLNQVQSIGTFVKSMIPPGTTFSPDLVTGFAKQIPEFGAYLDEVGASPTGIVALRGAIASFLEDGMYDLHSLGTLERAGYTVSKVMKDRNRKLAKGAQVLGKYNLPTDFDWAHIDDIANMGFMSLMEQQIAGGAHILEYRKGAMTTEQLHHYGTAWGTQAIRHIEDPIIRKYGLGRIAAAGDGMVDGNLNGAALVHEPTWARMEQTVWRMADEEGWFDRVANMTGHLRPDDLTEVPAADFRKAAVAAGRVKKNGRKVSETLTIYTQAEYRNMRTFLSPDGATGFALKDDGDIVTVFNVGSSGNGAAAVERGVLEGGTKLDAFDESGYLPDLYRKFGFKEVDRVAWDDAYKPKGWTGGTPDVVYMQLDEKLRNAKPTSVQLADAYLERKVDVMTKHILGPILGDDPVEAGRIANELRYTKGAELADGKSFQIGGSNHGTVQNTLRQYVIDNDINPDIQFPQAVAGMMDSRMFFDDDANVVVKSWQRITSKILEYAGEKATQQLNRRPGWLAAYRDNYRYLTEILGLEDEIAQGIARSKASEIVNYVFYNLDNGSPFLKSMNRFIPFFGAMWEVAQTWAYKIPMAGNTIMGPAMMVRKVDRAFDGLRSLGLIEFEDLVDEEGNVTDTTMYLTFDEDPHTGTPLGDTISKAGHKMLGLPRTFVMALAQARNLLTENDVNYDEEGFFKDSIRFQLGSPLAITGDQSHGIMAVNQLYLGMDPAKSFLANKVRNLVGLASDTKLADAEPGETLEELIARTGVDPGELIRTNSVYLRDLVGKDQYAQLLRGSLSPADVVLDGTEYFELPGSSFVDEMLDNVLFPFGAEDTVAGSLYDMLPSWTGFFMRGWGLWGSSGDPSNWTTLDNQGRVKLPEGELGLLEILNPPTNRMAIVGEINKQLLHLEASEGLITRWQKEVTKLEQLTQQAEEAGLRRITAGDLEEIENPLVAPELAEAWQDQKQLITELNAKILKRAVDNAGGAMIFRGIAGLLSPGNPRLLFEEETQTELYWDAMGMAAGDIRGSANWKLPDTLEGFEARQALVKLFLEDESGDSAKEWFKSHYPEISVFTQGTTYWEPGGKPPEMDSIDTYFEMVEAGLRQPLPPNVLMQKLGRAAVSIERDVALSETFGKDPWTAAAGIANDWTTYKEILDEARIKYEGLRWWDEVHDDGSYADWAGRNEDDTLTVVEELTRRYDQIADTIQYLEDFAPSQDMTDKQRRDYVNALKSTARGFRDFIGEWNEDLQSTFLDSPREVALNWYFDNVQAPYYEKLAELYDSLDTILDSEDRSRVYEDIRQFQTQEFTRRYYGEGGLEFPNALDFSWNKKSEAEQEERRLRWMGLKPEWLSLEGTTRLIQESPSLAPYLPSTPEQFEIYREYNNTVSMLADGKEPDPETGERMLTDTEYNKAKKELDKQFRAAMVAEGRLGELSYLEMYPIERLALANQLPPALIKYAGYASGIRQQLEQLDKGPTSQAGDAMFDRVYIELLDEMQRNPVIADEIMRFGSLMYDKHTIDSVFPALFYGGTFGEV